MLFKNRSRIETVRIVCFGAALGAIVVVGMCCGKIPWRLNTVAFSDGARLLRRFDSLELRGMTYSSGIAAISHEEPNNIQWADVTNAAKLPRGIARNHGATIKMARTEAMRHDGEAIYVVLKVVRAEASQTYVIEEYVLSRPDRRNEFLKRWVFW